MENLNENISFKTSFSGLFYIIKSRKLHTKKAYIYSTILVLVSNVLMFIFKDHITSLTYFNLLESFISTYLPALITFCGFSMTAYSLVVGFLNYGVFKTTIEEWYKLKLKNPSETQNILKYTIYQSGIGLFALTILLLLVTVFIGLLTKFIISINILVYCKYVELFNALILFILMLLCNYSFILMIYNIVNIFTFSQSLNKNIYVQEIIKLKTEESKTNKPE